MYSATAINHAYSDTGLFCIHASAPPTHLREMVEVIIREMVAMCGGVSDTELRVIFYSIFLTMRYCVVFISES